MTTKTFSGPERWKRFHAWLRQQRNTQEFAIRSYATFPVPFKDSPELIVEFVR